MCRITESKLPTAEESPSVTGDNEERKADQAENTRCQSTLLARAVIIQSGQEGRCTMRQGVALTSH